MRWDLTVTYVPGKHLGGTDALSRYGIRAHNDAMVNNITYAEVSPDKVEEATKDEATHASLLFLLADLDNQTSD